MRVGAHERGGPQEFLLRENLLELNDEVVAALALRGDVYQRGHHLTRIVMPVGEGAHDGGTALGRAKGAPLLEPIPTASLHELISDLGVFLRPTKNGATPVPPPRIIADQVTQRRTWAGLPHLTAVTEVPVVLPSGAVLERPGYDEASGLFFAPSFDPVKLPAPTPRNVRDARSLLDTQLLGDFPFETDAHKSAAMAALLTTLVRFAYDGPAPFFAFDASTPGTGKSLLATLLATIGTGGRGPTLFPPLEHDEEDRKRILAIAMSGDPVVLIDNITRPVGTPALLAALTTTTWSERILGRSARWTGELHTTWFGSGNQLAWANEMHRRVMPVRLAPGRERPEERPAESFRHANIRQWVRDNIAQLVAGALTLVRSYVDAGRPDQRLATWGSYEEWSDLVRGTLVYAGYADPYAAHRTLIEQDDDVGSSEREFVLALAELTTGRGPVTPQGVIDAAYPSNGTPSELALRLRDALEGIPMKDSRSTRSVGRAMSKLRDRVYGGCRIRKVSRREYLVTET